MISIGIDIGKFSVKIAEIEATARGFSLLRTEEIPLSADPTKDTRLEIVEILRNLVNQQDLSNTRFVLGMDQERVIVKQRQFPFKERYKILKSLAFELEDDIPFSQDDAIFDAKVARYLGPSAEILAVACPNENIAELLRLAHDGNIEPDVVSVDGLALANLFENWAAAPREDIQVDQPIPEPTSAEVILHLGHETTLMLILKDGYVADIRTLHWGGKDIADAIAKKYSIHYLEALKELRKKGFILVNPEGATKDQVAFSDTIRTSVDRLAHELNLALVDIKGTQGVKFTRLALTGGVGQLKNLGAYLTQKLEIASNRLKHVPHYPGLDFETSPQKEATCAIAIGLAIEGIKRPKNPPINLLKGEFAKQSQTLRLLAEKWSYTLQLAAAGFVILLIYAFMRDNLTLSSADQAREELRSKAQSLAQLKGSRATPYNARKYIQQQKRQADNRKRAEDLNRISSAMEVLKKISEVTPAKNMLQLNVFRLFVNNESVLMEGEVAQANTLPLLQNALKGLAKDGRVQPVPTQFRSTPGWTPFGYRFRVERKGGS